MKRCKIEKRRFGTWKRGRGRRKGSSTEQVVAANNWEVVPNDVRKISTEEDLMSKFVD